MRKAVLEQPLTSRALRAILRMYRPCLAQHLLHVNSAERDHSPWYRFSSTTVNVNAGVGLAEKSNGGRTKVYELSYTNTPFLCVF